MMFPVASTAATTKSFISGGILLKHFGHLMQQMNRTAAGKAMQFFKQPSQQNQQISGAKLFVHMRYGTLL